jgi:hypothetical protein
LSRVSYSLTANYSAAFSLELAGKSKMISRHAEITRKKCKTGTAVVAENVADGAAESALDEVGSDAVAEGD